MRRQRNTTQMKEETSNTEVQINEEEIGKLPEKEFRIMIVKIMIVKIIGSQKQNGEDGRDVYQRPVRTRKPTEMNHTLEAISSRITEAEEQISDLEDCVVKITVTEQNIEKRMKTMKTRLRGLWDNSKHTGICIIGSQKEKRERKDPRKYLKSR